MSETTEPTPPQAAAPKSKLLPLLLLINTAFGGAVLFLALRRPPAAAAPTAAAPAHGAAGEGAKGEHGAEHGAEHEGAAAPAPAHDEPEGNQPGPVVKLEGFVIQLRTAEADRYARVAFDIEIASEGDRKAVSDRLSQIRDAIIIYYSDRTLDELRGSEGIERTKVALLRKFDELVPGRRIRSLFITDFVIQ